MNYTEFSLFHKKGLLFFFFMYNRDINKILLDVLKTETVLVMILIIEERGKSDGT